MTAGPLELDNAILRNLLAETTRAYEAQMAELYAEKELAQVTLASIGDGVLATDEQGRVKYLNPVAEKLTGWDRAEALGRPLPEIFQLTGQGATTRTSRSCCATAWRRGRASASPSASPSSGATAGATRSRAPAPRSAPSTASSSAPCWSSRTSRTSA